ncbi:MAG: 50S ribosomal protein L6 [Sedimentisphaerales bacterium]|nr:50S ribosomal protein L6 [Sedimentisphaerales bacterium]
MSRIGKKPVVIPAGVKVEQSGRCIKVSGPLGSLQMDCDPRIKVKIDSSAGVVLVENERLEVRRNRQLHGTTRALIANMITGVSKGYERKLQIYGTGYNVKEQGGKLILQIGHCNPVEKPIPKGITVNIETAATKGDEVPAKFTLSGADKCILGRFAADVRKVKPPEPYKGKGIRYAGEYVKRKVGKAFASGTV